MPNPINLTNVRQGAAGKTRLPHAEAKRIVLAAAQAAANEEGQPVIAEHGDGITAVYPAAATDDPDAGR